MCDDVTYLSELMSDRHELSLCHGRFKHVERIVDQEIVNVRSLLFDGTMTEFDLPPPMGEPRLHKDRVYIPDFGRKFNFVGRLLGPRGKTLKRIEQDTGCKLMIRGEGSQRQPNFGPYGARWDSAMSSFFPHSPTTTTPSSCFSPTSQQHPHAPAIFNPMLPPPTSASSHGPGPIGSPTHSVFGSTGGGSLTPTHSSSGSLFHFSPSDKSSAIHTQPNASAGFNPFMMHRSKPKQEEGANEPLHVLIQCEDTPNRAFVRLSVAKSLILKLFQPVDEAHDELKHKQLLELSLMNGTFKAVPQLQTPRKQWPPPSF